MDDFNEFVGHFNESVDQQLSLLPAKRMELERRGQVIARDIEILAGEAARMDEFAQQEQDYAESFQAGLAYSQYIKVFIRPSWS